MEINPRTIDKYAKESNKLCRYQILFQLDSIKVHNLLSIKLHFF